jgi:hypothetical protein
MYFFLRHPSPRFADPGVEKIFQESEKILNSGPASEPRE